MSIKPKILFIVDTLLEVSSLLRNTETPDIALVNVKLLAVSNSLLHEGPSNMPEVALEQILITISIIDAEFKRLKLSNQIFSEICETLEPRPL